MKRHTVIIAIAACFFSLFAAAASAELKIGTTAGYFEPALPLFVAQAKGYFAEQGITVKTFIFQGGSEVRTQMVAGELDLGAQSSTHAGEAQAKGADIRYIMSIFEKGTIDFVVANSLKDKVKKVADLKGMKIGISRFGSLTWVMSYKYLKQAGLNPEKDVTFIEIGTNPGAILGAMKADKIDVYAAWTPVRQLLVEKSGVGYPLLDIMKPENHAKYIGSISSEAGIIATGKVIKDKGDEIRKFCAAMLKAVDYIGKTPSADIVALLMGNKDTAQYVAYDKDDFVKIVNLLKPGYTKTGKLSKKGWELGPYNALVEVDPKRFPPIPFEKANDGAFMGVTD